MQTTKSMYRKTKNSKQYHIQKNLPMKKKTFTVDVTYNSTCILWKFLLSTHPFSVIIYVFNFHE